MSKLKLVADPTFNAKVLIPVAGGEPVPVEFTFKHRTRDAIAQWIKDSESQTDVQIIKDLATAWELEDAFTDENIDLLCQNYTGAGFAVVETYLRELRGARRGN